MQFYNKNGKPREPAKKIRGINDGIVCEQTDTHGRIDVFFLLFVVGCRCLLRFFFISLFICLLPCRRGDLRVIIIISCIDNNFFFRFGFQCGRWSFFLLLLWPSHYKQFSDEITWVHSKLTVLWEN